MHPFSFEKELSILFSSRDSFEKEKLQQKPNVVRISRYLKSEQIYLLYILCIYILSDIRTFFVLSILEIESGTCWTRVFFLFCLVYV